MKSILSFLFFILWFSPFESLASVDSISTDGKKWNRHLESLLFVSIHTENDPKFLDWAEDYCDSLSQIAGFESIANAQRVRINQTRDICGDNLNHRAPLLEMFRGRPEYMGFADDAVEYALEDALEKLISRPLIFNSRTEIKNGALNAIVQRGTVSDDLWEIALDILDMETNHKFHRIMTLPNNNIDSLIWFAQQNPNNSNLKNLADAKGINRFAVFQLNVQDCVDETLWIVEMNVRIWDEKEAFGPTISAKGFCEDKTSSPFLWNLFDFVLLGFLLLTLISGIEHMQWGAIKDKWDSLESTQEKLLWIVLTPMYICKVAVKRMPKTLLFLFIPSIASYIIIHACGPLVPGPTTHYQEVVAKLWIIGTAFGMSLIPTILNFFLLNRLNIDGFHSMKSYRDLANVSLFGSFIPVMYLHEVNGTSMHQSFIYILILATWMAGDLLAFCIAELFSASKSLRTKRVAIFGLILGVAGVVKLTFLVIGSADIFLSILITVVGGLVNLIWRPLMKWAQNKDSLVGQGINQDADLEEGNYVSSLVPNFDQILHDIKSSEFRSGFIIGPTGIGKTRLVKEIEKQLVSNDQDWRVFMGDCDELQEEGHLAFEPFVEAFGNFLNIDEVVDRAEMIDSLGQSAISSVSDFAPVSVEFKPVEENNQRSLEDFAMHLVEKLEKTKANILFILDDVQWMDEDSKKLLQTFLGMVSRNNKLKNRFKFLCTYREEDASVSKRIDRNDFHELMEKLGAKSILETEGFICKDFLKNLSDTNDEFNVSTNSLYDLNTVLNQKLETDSTSEIQVVTPLYIIRNIGLLQSNGILVKGSDGWVLSKKITVDDLPNSEAVDAHFHQIFSAYPAKWMRVLESASIVGRSFDATVLSAVWGYELLEVLDFLEQLEAQGILEDVREEDNVYRFKDKRAVAGIKSFFPNNSGDRNARQIVIEYNKRLVNNNSDMILKRALHKSGDLWKHLERLLKVPTTDDQNIDAFYLIEELAIRFALDAEEFGVSPLEKLSSLLSQYLKVAEANQINTLIAVIEDDSTEALKRIETLPVGSNSHLHGLVFYTRLLFDRSHVSNLAPGQYEMLDAETRNEIACRIHEYGQGSVWVGVMALLLNHPKITAEERQEISSLWKESVPLLSEAQNMTISTFELEIQGKDGDLEPNELLNYWQNHWIDVVEKGSLRHQKVVAKAILKAIKSKTKNYREAINWFITEESHFRVNKNEGITIIWFQVFQELLLNAYCKNLLCLEHAEQLRIWMDEIETYFDLRFGEELFSPSFFNFKKYKIEVEFKINPEHKDELRIEADKLHSYVKKFDCLHPKNVASALKTIANVSEHDKAFEILKEIYFIYINVNDNSLTSKKSIAAACKSLTMHCRNRLGNFEESLKWADEGLKWAQDIFKKDKNYNIVSYHFFKGAALGELRKFAEASIEFDLALNGIEPTSESSRFKIALYSMHKGASQVRANIEGGKELLKTAIESLESSELSPFVTKSNSNKIQELKSLLKD